MKDGVIPAASTLNMVLTKFLFLESLVHSLITYPKFLYLCNTRNVRCSLLFVKVNPLGHLKIQENVRRREHFCLKGIEAEIIQVNSKGGKIGIATHFSFWLVLFFSVVSIDIRHPNNSACLFFYKLESQKSIKVSSLCQSIGQ